MKLIKAKTLTLSLLVSATVTSQGYSMDLKWFQAGLEKKVGAPVHETVVAEASKGGKFAEEMQKVVVEDKNLSADEFGLGRIADKSTPLPTFVENRAVEVALAAQPAADYNERQATLEAVRARLRSGVRGPISSAAGQQFIADHLYLHQIGVNQGMAETFALNTLRGRNPALFGYNPPAVDVRAEAALVQSIFPTEVYRQFFEQPNGRQLIQALLGSQPELAAGLNENLRLARTGATNITISEIDESFELRDGARLGRAPTIDEIRESLRLKALGVEEPDGEQIDHGIQLKTANETPTLAQVNASVEFTAANPGQNLNLEQVKKYIELKTPANPNPTLAQINAALAADAALRLGGAGAPRNLERNRLIAAHMAAPSDAEVDEGIRLTVLNGAAGPATPAQIADGLRATRIMGAGSAPTLAQIARINVLSGAAAAGGFGREVTREEFNEDVRLTAPGVVPTPEQITEGLRLTRVLGHPATMAEIQNSLRIAGVLHHLPSREEIETDANLAVELGHAPTLADFTADHQIRVANPRANAAERRLTRVLGHAPSAAEVAEDARLTGILGHIPSAAEHATSARLRGILGRDPVVNDFVEDGRLQGVVGHVPTAADYARDTRIANRVGGGHVPTAAEHAEDARLEAVVGHAPTAADYARDAAIAARIGGGHVPTAADHAQEIRLAGVLGHAPNAADYARDTRIANRIGGGHVPTAAEHAEDARLEAVVGHAPTAADYARDARLNARLGHAPVAADHAEDVRLEAVVGHAPTAADYARDAHIRTIPAAMAGAHPTAAEHAEDVRLEAIIGHQTTAADYVEDARLGAVVGHVPTAADYARDTRIANRVGGGHVPTAAEHAEDARLEAVVGHAPTAADYARDAAIAARIGGGHVPTAADHAQEIRLAGVLGHAPNAADYARDTRIANRVGGGHVPTAAEHAEDARLEAVVGHAPTAADYARDARLNARLGHAPVAADHAEDVRLEAVVGHVPTAADYARDAHIRTIPAAMAGAHPTAAEHAEDVRLEAVVGHPTTAADYARDAAIAARIGGGHVPTAADHAQEIRLAGVLGHAPNAADYARDTRIANRIGGGHVPTAAEHAEDARLEAVVGHAPTAADYARDAHIRTIPAAMAGAHPTAAEHAEDARLEAVVGHPTTAADYARDAHIRTIPAAMAGAHPTAAEHAEDARLEAVVGHPTTAADYARDAHIRAIPGLMAGAHPTAAEHAEDARLEAITGGATTRQVYDIDANIQAVEGRVSTAVDYNNWQAALNVAVIAAHGAGGGNVVDYWVEATRLVRLLNAANTAIAACVLPNANQIEQGVAFAGRDASLEEIDEALRISAIGAFVPTYDQTVASCLLNTMQARDGHPGRTWAQARLAGVADIDATAAELDECNRLIDAVGFADTEDLYATVQDALRIRNLPGIGGANPFAGGLTLDQVTEAKRLRTLALPGGAVNPFAGGVTIKQLQEALLLKAMPEFAAGATPADILASIYLKTPAGGLGGFGAAAPIAAPTAAEIKACVLLQTQQAAGAAVANPTAAQVDAVAKPELDDAMKQMLARAIQNPIPGVGAGNIPYGIARITNIDAANSRAQIQFVKVTPGNLHNTVYPHVFNQGLGFDAGVGLGAAGAIIPGGLPAGNSADAVRVGINPVPGAGAPAAVAGRLPAVGLAVGDYVAFTDMVNDGAHNGPNPGAHHVRLDNVTKVN